MACPVTRESSADRRIREQTRYVEGVIPRPAVSRSVKQAKVCLEVTPAAAGVVEDEHAFVVQVLGAVSAERFAGASIGDADAVVPADN